MSEVRMCDLCGDGLGEVDVRYAVDRHDVYGHYDTLDVCSPECLAAMAVGEGHERGERQEVRRPKLQPEPVSKRRWRWGK